MSAGSRFWHAWLLSKANVLLSCLSAKRRPGQAEVSIRPRFQQVLGKDLNYRTSAAQPLPLGVALSLSRHEDAPRETRVQPWGMPVAEGKAVGSLGGSGHAVLGLKRAHR